LKAEVEARQAGSGTNRLNPAATVPQSRVPSIPGGNAGIVVTPTKKDIHQLPWPTISTDSARKGAGRKSTTDLRSAPNSQTPGARHVKRSPPLIYMSVGEQKNFNVFFIFFVFELRNFIYQ
jgi:hypothetical protein